MRVVLRCVLAAVLLLGGCFGDRPRPSPVGPDSQPRLYVEVMAPAHNSLAMAGQPVPVDVSARDLDGSRLIGIGFVAYRVQGGERIDSAAYVFAPRSAARDTFVFMLPADYPTNTQVDIFGLAFGVGGASQSTVPRSILVISATPTLHASEAGMESALWRGETSCAGDEIVSLEHAHEDCVGNWRLLGSTTERTVQCDRCAALYPASAENRLAAIDENYAGIYLRRLASEGAAYLSGERDP